MDSNVIERLASINIEDLLSSLGLENLRTGRRQLGQIFRGPARRFSRTVITYDDYVFQLGLQMGAARFLAGYIRSLTITGQEHIPAEGPLLVLSNHPGMVDTVSLFAGLPRKDLKVVAADRPFLRALPATCEHLIFVPDQESMRLSTLRSIALHLRAGGAILTFPAGQIEPDPACMPGAAESLESWSDSIGFFARLVPDACIVPAIVSGVIAAPSLRHPLTRLRRQQKDRERLAAALQLLSQIYFPSRWPLDVQVRFAPPISARDLGEQADQTAMTRGVISYIQRFMAAGRA